MLPTLSFFSLVLALIALTMLAAIDLRTRLLPNVLVLGFAALGYLFHTGLLFEYAAPRDMLAGALAGGGMLTAIRAAGNAYYKQDTLGLGDVKLMAAAGIWLGAQDTLMALTLGALLGALHGGAVLAFCKARKQEAGPLSTFAVPAGPGFIGGILLAGGYALVNSGALAHAAW